MGISWHMFKIIYVENDMRRNSFSYYKAGAYGGKQNQNQTNIDYVNKYRLFRNIHIY